MMCCSAAVWRIVAEQWRKAILPAPQGMRKVVLATNIAETSLTIEGIRLVVDCPGKGGAFRSAYRAYAVDLFQRVSQRRSAQRAGRAGVCEPGICLI
ncbi:hypothetical protein ACNKHM_06850 [Shigella sonnei]